jgi:hypothetical protein
MDLRLPSSTILPLTSTCLSKLHLPLAPAKAREPVASPRGRPTSTCNRRSLVLAGRRAEADPVAPSPQRAETLDGVRRNRLRERS